MRNYLSFLLLLGCCQLTFAQESDSIQVLKNQVSTNVALLTTLSPNLTFERTLGDHFSIDISGSLYGEPHKNMELISAGYRTSANHEINPFARWYMNGTQRRSHFLELFASSNEVTKENKRVRVVNEEGYGVYVLGDREETNFGLGIGYGYRFFLLDNKLLLEAEFGLRTNFDVGFIFFVPAIVRTGIRVGYRF